MTWAEAKKAAETLGGLLPTARQWDVAAGYYRARRERDGPGEVSPYGIRDMGRTGREWTRTPLQVNGEEFAVLRGWSDTLPRPLSYKDMDGWLQGGLCPRQLPQHASPTTGLRVVVEFGAP
jgi:hypothetical protein